MSKKEKADFPTSIRSSENNLLRDLGEMTPGPGLRKEIMASSLDELDKETTNSFESARSVVESDSFN